MSIHSLTLNTPMCDWVTFTSFDDGLYAWFTEQLGDDDSFDETSRMQYQGRQYKSVFIGTAEQGGREHNLVQISGAAANTYVGKFGHDTDRVRCSRIDIQVTCDTGNYINMFSLAQRQKGKKRLVGFIESGGLATVYVGSWKSNKFLRIYQKSRTMLRMEICYKGSKANYVHKDIAAGDTLTKMRGMLKYELLSLNDPMLDSVFGSSLAGDGIKSASAPRGETQTEKWIMESVLPALTRYANSHDVDYNVIRAIHEAIAHRSEQYVDNPI